MTMTVSGIPLVVLFEESTHVGEVAIGQSEIVDVTPHRSKAITHGLLYFWGRCFVLMSR